jgi:O6-methylguanine-DNA--protein-cysteine methyltransferase
VRRLRRLEYRHAIGDPSGNTRVAGARQEVARQRGGEVSSVQQCVAVSSPEKGSAVTSVSSCSTVHGGEVRSRGDIARRTREGRAQREAVAAAMAAWLAVRSG